MVIKSKVQGSKYFMLKHTNELPRVRVRLGTSYLLASQVGQMRPC